MKFFILFFIFSFLYFNIENKSTKIGHFINYFIILCIDKHFWNFYLKEFKENLVIISTQTCLLDSLLLCYSSLIMAGNVNNFYGISKNEAHYLKYWPKLFGNDFIIFIKRDKKLGQVKQITDKLKKLNKKFILYIFPEGKRKPVDRWKSGFYYIAKEMKCNIGIIGIDHKDKSVYLDSIIKPKNTFEKTLNIVKNRLKKYIPYRKDYIKY